MASPRPPRLLMVGLVALAAACGSSAGDVSVATGDPAATSTLAPQAFADPDPNPSSTTTDPPAPPPTSSTTTTPATTTTTSTTTTATTTTTTTTRTTTPAPRYVELGHVPFAMADGVELVSPATTIELIGFHEAGHDGSKQQEVYPVVERWLTLDTRGRGTGSRTAADIVVPFDTEIRAPVSGTVIRGGTYVLYCDHSDDFVVIEPDARPGWEVKMFHFDGLQVAVGDRVEAGVTVIAPRPTPLPFESQVDEFTSSPSNPHVHVEVIDPSIPDIPTPGGGC